MEEDYKISIRNCVLELKGKNTITGIEFDNHDLLLKFVDDHLNLTQEELKQVLNSL